MDYDDINNHMTESQKTSLRSAALQQMAGNQMTYDEINNCLSEQQKTSLMVAALQSMVEEISGEPQEYTNYDDVNNHLSEQQKSSLMASALMFLKDNSGGGGVAVESLSVTQNGTYEEEGKAYSPVVVNVPTPEFTLTPNRIVLGGQTGAVEVKPMVSVDITESLTSLNSMFASDGGVTSVAFDPAIDMTNVTTAVQTFNLATNLTSVSIPNTFSLRLTSASGMFQSCSKLETVSLSQSFTPYDCSSMFNGCSVLETISDLSHLSPRYASYMFNGCRKLAEFPHINLRECSNLQGAFGYVGAANTTAPTISMVYDFSGASGTNAISSIFGGFDYDSGGKGATQSSVDYMLQSLLTLTNNYSGNKTYRTIFGFDVSTSNNYSGHLANLILNSPYYQDMLNAGWPAIS